MVGSFRRGSGRAWVSSGWLTQLWWIDRKWKAKMDGKSLSTHDRGTRNRTAGENSVISKVNQESYGNWIHRHSEWYFHNSHHVTRYSCSTMFLLTHLVQVLAHLPREKAWFMLQQTSNLQSIRDYLGSRASRMQGSSAYAINLVLAS